MHGEIKVTRKKAASLKDGALVVSFVIGGEVISCVQELKPWNQSILKKNAEDLAVSLFWKELIKAIPKSDFDQRVL